jgi:hypothetical protein
MRILKDSELLLLDSAETKRSPVDRDDFVYLAFEGIAIIDPAKEPTCKRIEACERSRRQGQR